jgi:hypothetical protein
MQTSATTGFWQSILAIPTMLQEDAFTKLSILSVYLYIYGFTTFPIFITPGRCPVALNTDSGVKIEPASVHVKGHSHGKCGLDYCFISNQDKDSQCEPNFPDCKNSHLRGCKFLSMLKFFILIAVDLFTMV